MQDVGQWSKDKCHASGAEVVQVGEIGVRMRRSVRYLEVVIDKMGNLQVHVRGRAAVAKLRPKKLNPVLTLDSEVDLDTRVKILKMIA